MTDEIFLKTKEEVSAEKVELPSEPQHHKIEFTGTAGEYFRIWIVNTFLSILTFGIYAAWAKVRTRQYFYAHTGIGGHSFEYLANPLAILKGNLIIGGGFILYMIAGNYNQTAAGIIVVLFYLILPFLIFKTLRFYAHNSSFRNVRFRFLGTMGECYKIFLLFPFLIPFTLGILIPYWLFRQKKYFFDNFAFGATKNSFNGRQGFFYMTFLIISGISFAIMMFFGIIIFPLAKDFFTSPSEFSPSHILPMMFVMYVVLIVVSVVFQQYIYARINNYCWKESELGTIRFLSTFSFWELTWIRISNIFAIIFSVGLLIPWAKIRRTRYILDNITIIALGSLDDFTSAVGVDESAVGEAATDFFDFEIGL